MDHTCLIDGLSKYAELLKLWPPQTPSLTMLIIVECDKFKFSSTLPPNVDLKNVLKKPWNIDLSIVGRCLGYFFRCFIFPRKHDLEKRSDCACEVFSKKLKPRPKEHQEWSDSLLQGDLKKKFRSTFGAEVDENFDWPHSTITKWWKHGLIWSLLRPQLHGLNELWKIVSVSSLNR